MEQTKTKKEKEKMQKTKLIHKLGIDLGNKYFRKGEDQLWACEMIHDINTYKKYEKLNCFEMLEVLKIAMEKIAEDFDDMLQFLTESYDGRPEDVFL